MKCPQCKKSVKSTDHYCPHCGCHLDAAKDKGLMRQPLTPAILLILAGIVLPLAMMYMSRSPVTTDSLSAYTIGDYEETYLDAEFENFETMESFSVAVTNAATFTTPVNDYVALMDKTYNTTFDVSTSWTLYSSNNLATDILMTSDLNNNASLRIERTYNRARTQDDIAMRLVVTNLKSFDDLLLTDYKDTLTLMMGEKTLSALTEAFKAKEDEFNQTRKTLGHLGMGVHQDGCAMSVTKGETSGTYTMSVNVWQDGDYSLVA